MEHNWAEIQQYYNLGHNWKQVTAQFGIHNAAIQKAVRAGILISRNRADAIAMARGNKGYRKSMAKCLECKIDFEYKQGSSKGKYCSNSCRANHWREHIIVPSILAGEASTQTVKKYLLRQEPSCTKCGLGEEWQGERISLEIDHIDGNSDNNALSNVRLLCPNCHSQTPNYGIRNRGAGAKRNVRMKEYRQSNNAPAGLTR